MADLSHLSLLDGAFLHLESPEMPMHVGSLALFEAPPPNAAPGSTRCGRTYSRACTWRRCSPASSR